MLPDIGESPQHIAFRLFELILVEEGKKTPKTIINADWILRTYAKCLRTVRKPEERAKPSVKRSEDTSEKTP